MNMDILVSDLIVALLAYVAKLLAFCSQIGRSDSYQKIKSLYLFHLQDANEITITNTQKEFLLDLAWAFNPTSIRKVRHPKY